MPKYLLLKHYRGGPQPYRPFPPMDQWAPEDVEAHMAFLRHVGELLKKNGEYVDGQALTPARTWVRYGGHGRLELSKFHAPPGGGGDLHAPANTPGIRHVAFAVDDIDAVVAGLRARGAELVGEVERYKDSYRICYVRGPEGIIVELAEQIG